MNRKVIVVFAVSLMMTIGAKAQVATSGLFTEGTQIVKGGISLGASGLPVEFSYEKGLKDNVFNVDNLNFGLGGYLGYQGYKEDFYGGHYKYTNIILGARGMFHYAFVNKLDTYAGLMLGYNISSAKWSGDHDPGNASSGGLVLGGLVGARYEFNPKWSAYGELGYSVGFLNIGVAYKL